MASSNLGKVVSEEVECAICLENLDKPRMLSCLHSFCEKCLLKTLDGDTPDTVQCALCKTSTSLPSTGVNGLRLDFRAAKLVEALVESAKTKEKISCPSQKCEACGFVDSSSSGKESPFTFCRECCQLLCARCSAAHAGLRFTQTHTVAKIAELLEGKVTIQSKDQATFCPKHRDEKIRLFCLTCSEMVCCDCAVIDHSVEKGHQFQFVQNYISTIQTKLTSQLTQVKAKTEKLSVFLKSLDKANAIITRQDEQVTKDINTTIKEHIRSVKGMEEIVVGDKRRFMDEKRNQIKELRQQTQQMKMFAEKSSKMTEEMLSNSEDIVGIASMSKSLEDAMDKVIAMEPNEHQLNTVQESVESLHYHSLPSAVKVGKLVAACECKEKREVALDLRCANGPKGMQFTHHGRLAALTENLFLTGNMETVYDQRGHGRNAYYAARQIESQTSTLCIKQTAASFPECTTFPWDRSLSNQRYEDIRAFATLSDHRFVLTTTDNKLLILKDTLTDMCKDLPKNRNLSGIATDSKDNIYISDEDNRRVYILRDDGSMYKSVSTDNISPTGIAVCHVRPRHIVVTHEPATVYILNTDGKIQSSIHQDDWKKVAIGCSTDHLYLWASGCNRMTLQRYTMEGTLSETIFEDTFTGFGSFSFYPLFVPIIAVAPDGTVAIVRRQGHLGKVRVFPSGQVNI